MYYWEWQDERSDSANIVCSLEMTLWNLGIESSPGNCVGDNDWSWKEVNNFVMEHG